MSVSHYQKPDRIIIPSYHTNDTSTPTVLQGIELREHAFNETPLAERDNNSLVRNEIFNIKLSLSLGANFGSP